MSLLLNIDTALSKASVCLSKDSQPISFIENEQQQSHAAWLHTGIEEMMKEAGLSIKQLDGVSVSIGPGSYTGLRVGLSSAKGICYALNIPLITIPTTELLAFAVRDEAVDLICPAIDARRMEIYTAIFDKDLKEIKAPHPLILNEKSFDEFLIDHHILFCGDGCKKLQSVIANKKVSFSESIGNASHLAQIASNRYASKIFADLAYVEPLYVKDFFSIERKN